MVSIRRDVRRYVVILTVLTVIAIAITPIYEPVAIRYGAWAYGAAYMYNIHILGAEAETYLYSGLVMLSIACVTLFLADVEEKGGLSLVRLRRSLFGWIDGIRK